MRAYRQCSMFAQRVHCSDESHQGSYPCCIHSPPAVSMHVNCATPVPTELKNPSRQLASHVSPNLVPSVHTVNALLSSAAPSSVLQRFPSQSEQARNMHVSIIGTIV